MNKLFAYALLSIGLVSCAELAQLPGLETGSGGGLSNADVVAGLKEALVKGAQESTARSSAVDGFWQNAAIRIPFPPEAQQMKSTLVSIGLGSQVDKFELTLNRAAEEAAKEALPVLRDAVTSMTVADGFAILRGGDHAATNYLREKTSSALTARFKPIVQRATQKVALTSYWTPLANGYNQASILTGTKAVDPRSGCLRDTGRDQWALRSHRRGGSPHSYGSIGTHQRSPQARVRQPIERGVPGANSAWALHLVEGSVGVQAISPRGQAGYTVTGDPAHWRYVPSFVLGY